MLIKLLNDIMYKEDKKENTYLYKWAKENGYKYRYVWQAVQVLQDSLYYLQNSKNSFAKLSLVLKGKEEEIEQLTIKMD